MPNATLVNFAAGETSPKSRGRFDIASYNSSCRKMENFIADVQGSARYRNGFKHLAETRGGAVARVIPFQYNDDQAYMLEFTDLKMRVYKNGELHTVARTTITGITKANPAVITVAATTDLANGDEVIITGIVGMTELNGRQVKLAGASGSTFQLVDPTTGSNINSTGFGTYVSGGTLVEVYEIATPYLAADLPDLQFVQARNVLYLNHPAYQPRKLTVDSSDVFTLSTVTLTNDPFAVGGSLGITDIVVYGAGVPMLVYFSVGSTFIPGAVYTFAGVTRVVALNGVGYYLEQMTPGSRACYLKIVATGAYEDGASGSSGGENPATATAAPDKDKPISVAAYEGRLVFGGTNSRPSTVFMSRSPNPSTGASRLEDFTGGTDADHACFFSLAPISGSGDYISWAGGTSKYLLIGTFGGPFRISGGGLDEPITPSAINARQLDAYGCEAVMPALNGALAYYIQRGGKTLRAIKYAVDVDDFASVDMCLNADQIGDSALSRVVFRAGRPDALWVVRSDGQLASCTISGSEQIAGWHRHVIAGTAAKVLDVGVLPRTDQNDQLYVVTERTINGATRRAVEVLADEIVFPDIEDYYGAAATEALDAAAYRTAVNALINTSVHLDAYETYNSTPATLIQGLHHLEGETVTAVADGVERTGLTVANGAITLPVAASVVHVGLPYTGYLQTQNLELGGRSGPAQAKPRNIVGLNIRFLNSKGGSYGTDLYHLYDIETEDAGALTLADGSAAPLFNGVRKLTHFDNWSTENDRNEKTVFVKQSKPFPCVVQFIDIEYETGDE